MNEFMSTSLYDNDMNDTGSLTVLAYNTADEEV